MKIAICAALYESGRPFLDEYVAALRTAAEGRDCLFVAAIDGLKNPQEALADLAEHLEIVTVDVPAGHTPAGVRCAMLAAGQRCEVDVLVFTDMDDLIAPRGLHSHLDALADADFSYGDMELIDVSGHRMGRRFFDDAGVPDRLDDIAAIHDRNFLGFSNTAVRVNRIAPVALVIPEDIVAADWWFFSMLLLGGLRGKKTVGPVAAYRIHDANTLGVGGPLTAPGAIAQTEAMLRHYRSFSALPALAGRAEATEKVLAKLGRIPAEELDAHLSAFNEEAGTWFESIGRIADRLSAEPLTGSNAL